MLFSRLPPPGRQGLLLLLVLQLYACSSGNGNANTTVPESQVGNPSANINVSISTPDTYALDVDISNGGYVFDTDTDLLCLDQSRGCKRDIDVNEIKTLRAISRFGYEFAGWNISSIQAQTLDIAVTQDIDITASFRPVNTSTTMLADYQKWSCNSSDASNFRALHLGDSLTQGPTPGFDDQVRDYMPEPASIAFYEQHAGDRIQEPLILATRGYLVAGRPEGGLEQEITEEHYWKQEAEKQHFTVEDFDVAVVALGSNDEIQIAFGLDPDFVIEHRVKPLLQWLGNRQVYWILPHYGYWPRTMQGINFSGKADGLHCACNSRGNPASTQCNIVSEMQVCAVDQALQQRTIDAFRIIHTLRERLAALQDEYDNVIVIDPVQTVAAASNNQHDLYATISPQKDTIHFSLQGAEWYAWLHAWLALHADPNCSLPALQKWRMGPAEVAMAAELDSVP